MSTSAANNGAVTHSYAVRVVRNLSAYLEDHRNCEIYRVRATNATAAMLGARRVSGAAVAMDATRIEPVATVQTPEGALS
ncbi:MAG: hypothetical protein ACK5PF_11550 [bacterium]